MYSIFALNIFLFFLDLFHLFYQPTMTPHSGSLCDLPSQNVYVSVPAYKTLSCQAFVFIVIPSITKKICSFTRALFITLFAGHKIDKTLIIITVQTMFNLKSVSAVTVLLNVDMSVTLLQTSHRCLPHFEESTFLSNGYSLA